MIQPALPITERLKREYINSYILNKDKPSLHCEANAHLFREILGDYLTDREMVALDDRAEKEYLLFRIRNDGV